MLTTGRKESLSASKGSVVEVASSNLKWIWYCAVLEENIAKSKRKKISVRHLDPLLNGDYSTPFLKSTLHHLIRPVPPPDLLSVVDFEVGDEIEAARKGAWWTGSVIKVLGNERYLVILIFDDVVMEVDRKNLRPHLVWEDEEWFRFEKKELIETDFSAGKTIEVRTEVEHLGDVWTPAIAIKHNGNGTLLVKLNNSFKAQEGECATISLPYSKVRPSPPPFRCERIYNLMENVEALLESGWCPCVIRTVHIEKKYGVLLGQSKERQEFNHLQLRPSMEWKNGVWEPQELFQVLSNKESRDSPQETTRIRNIKALSTGKHLMARRSSGGVMQQKPSPASSNGGVVAEVAKVSATESVKTPLSKTAAQLAGEQGSQTANAVTNEKTIVTSQPETTASVAATSLKRPTVKTQGKTSPRKKLQTMKNQKGSANDSVGEKAPEEVTNKESVNKRKRGQPRKFVSTEPKQKAGSKSATIDFANMTDDDQPLASWIHGGNTSLGSGTPASRTPDPMLNSVVEKHVDVMETPPPRDTTMVLPFVKKSPLWKFLESMEPFKAVPQRPHFSPLLESEEESREGDAIGAMVMFTSLLEKVNKIQVDDPVNSIHRINECFLKLEKHGFDITVPRTRIEKLLSIKESQTWALDELKAVEKDITEKDNKRRKCEEDIEDLSRKILELKEGKLMMDKEIARMQSHTAVLDQKVRNIEEEFRANAAAPWK